jgi:hypothetical protein
MGTMSVKTDVDHRRLVRIAGRGIAAGALLATLVLPGTSNAWGMSRAGPGVGYGRVSGRVTAAPTCPVERAGHPCPPRPVRATIDALTTHGRVVTTVRTDAHGRYAVRLAPGNYLLRVTSPSAFPRCPDVRIKVKARWRTRANSRCDTGIR